MSGAVVILTFLLMFCSLTSGYRLDFKADGSENDDYGVRKRLCPPLMCDSADEDYARPVKRNADGYVPMVFGHPMTYKDEQLFRAIAAYRRRKQALRQRRWRN